MQGENVGRQIVRARALIGALLIGVLGVLVLSAPEAGARAKSVKGLKGQVIAPPALSKKQVSPPVLLNPRSQRRLRLDSPITVLVVKRSTMVRAPRASGEGTTRIEAEKMRAGDTVKAKVKVKKKKGKKGKSKRMARRALQARARKGSPATLKARSRSVRIIKRESRYSVDELTDIVIWLAEQVSALSKRVDGLDAQIAALNAKLAGLQTALDAVKGDVSGLSADISKLKDDLAALASRVTDLEGDVAGMLTDLGGALDDIDQLQTDVTALQGSVGTLQTDVGALCTAVNALVAPLPPVC